jgi:hypothetical protein
MFVVEVLHELLHTIDYNVFVFFNKYNACNYIPHNAFFMNPIKGMEISFEFKQLYEKKSTIFYFYFFMLNMKNSIKLIFQDSKQGIKHCT